MFLVVNNDTVYYTTRLEETCSHTNSSGKPSANTGVKNSQMNIIIIKIIIQTTVLLKSEYLEESWKPEETCCHPDSRERPPAKTSMKICKK